MTGVLAYFAADLVDGGPMGTKLGYMSLLFDPWCLVAQGLEPARETVEAFDLLEHVLPYLGIPETGSSSCL